MTRGFTLKIHINTNRFFSILLGIVIFLIVMGAISAALQTYTNYESALGFIPLFNLDAEGTAPSYFSSFNLGFAAVLLVLIAQDRKQRGDSFWRHWLGLGLGFFLMSVDESVALHEKIVHLVESTLVSQSYVINYGIAAFGLTVSLVIFIFYFKFLLYLSPKTRRNFIVSGLIFITGAFVAEAVGGYIWHHSNQSERGAYYLTAVIEESLEIIGILLFVKSLFIYIENNLQADSPTLTR